jgi:hypothetical protein
MRLFVSIFVIKPFLLVPLDMTRFRILSNICEFIYIVNDSLDSLVYSLMVSWESQIYFAPWNRDSLAYSLPEGRDCPGWIHRGVNRNWFATNLLVPSTLGSKTPLSWLSAALGTQVQSSQGCWDSLVCSPLDSRDSLEYSSLESLFGHRKKKVVLQIFNSMPKPLQELQFTRLTVDYFMYLMTWDSCGKNILT